MFGFVYNFFNISSLNPDAKKFVMRTSLVHYLFVFIISFANMFIFLQAVKLLNNLSEVAILLGVFLLTQAIFAFPAGALGDSRSFRIVLSLSVFFYFITYRLVVISQTFDEFIVLYIILGISSAFLMENFFSFFDNNYDYFVYEDTNRAIYSEFVGKFVAIKSLVLALGIIIGSYISVVYTRVNLFSYDSYVLIIVLLLTIVVFKDHKNFKQKKKTNKSSFFGTMISTIKFAWKKRTLRFFIIGFVVADLTVVLWEQFYSILLYSQIGKTDYYIGILFSSEIIITAILTGFLGIIAGKVTKIKLWFLVSLLISYIFFFFGLNLFLTYNTIPELFSLNYTIIFLAVLFIIYIPMNFNNILYYRTILDLMPESYRGSIYSLMAALTSIAGAIILFVFSKYLSNISLANSFYYLGLIGLLGSIIVFFSLIRYEFKTTIKENMGFLTAFLANTKAGFSNFFLIQQNEKLGSYQIQINNIVKELSAIAMADMQITPEEKNLIDIIITDIQAYFTMLNEFENDKSTAKKEKKELLAKQKENILKHAYVNIANNMMSEELTRIIEKLNEIMNTI